MAFITRSSGFSQPLEIALLQGVAQRGQDVNVVMVSLVGVIHRQPVLESVSSLGLLGFKDGENAL